MVRLNASFRRKRGLHAVGPGTYEERMAMARFSLVFVSSLGGGGPDRERSSREPAAEERVAARSAPGPMFVPAPGAGPERPDHIGRAR